MPDTRSDEQKGKAMLLMRFFLGAMAEESFLKECDNIFEITHKSIMSNPKEFAGLGRKENAR